MNELERTALNEVLRTATYIAEKKGEEEMAKKEFKSSFIDRKKLSSSLKTLMTQQAIERAELAESQRKELEEFLKNLL